MKYLLSGGVGTERGVGARAYTPSLVRVERPCTHSRDSRYTAKRTARMHAHCARRRRADGRPAIPVVSLVPSARPFRFFPFECFFLFLAFNASFFPPAATLPPRLHAKTNTTVIYLAGSRGRARNLPRLNCI